MNKELIRKYKDEFDHWLNGGKLQAKFVYDQWVEAPKDIFSYNMVNFVLVIDDEYVEFRRALAEGKTIQCNAKENENDITYTAYGHMWWTDTTEFKYATSFYRIKPEEPKFKVGDWVVHNGVIKQVTMTVNGLINSLDKQLVVIKKEESLELWQPRPGEWCWVYDKTTRIPVLRKFVCMNTKGETDYTTAFPYEVENIDPSSILHFRYIEPFIGQLPTILKETK